MQKELFPNASQDRIKDDPYQRSLEKAIQSVIEGKSWPDIHEELNQRRVELLPLMDQFYGHVLHFFSDNAQVDLTPENGLVEFIFSEVEIALAFSSFLSFILPIQENVFPVHEDNIVTISQQEFYFCCLHYGGLYGGLESIIPDNYLLKSLRSDEFDFSHRFIMGIIPGETGARRQNLRPANRKSHTITHEKKIVERLNRTPMYSEERKKGFSQIQSTTLIDEKMKSPVFGAFKDRINKLYGVMTHCADALINRLLIRDCGTVRRPFDVNSDVTSIDGLAERIYSPDNIEEFKKQNLLFRESHGGTNEVLARLRYNPYRTIVCICADTLEARLLAYDFAQELLEEFKRYAERNSINVNPNFKIPIIFYLKNTMSKARFSHHVYLYTESMRLSDMRVASDIYSDPQYRSHKISQSDFEFLLGISGVTLDILKQPVLSDGTSLAFFMIGRGYIRMLMRLLRNNNLKEKFLDDLLSDNVIQCNDPIIAHFIQVEEFEIANKLIKETNSSIDKLTFRGIYLIEHIYTFGTPYLIDYLQRFHLKLERIFAQMVRIDRWQTIRLYLKEYPIKDRALLGKILLESFQYCKDHTELMFLIKLGADLSICNEQGKTIIVLAAERGNWELVSLISGYSTDPEDNAKFGMATVLALADKKIDLAIRLILSGAKLIEEYFDSAEKMNQTIDTIIVQEKNSASVILRQFFGFGEIAHRFAHKGDWSTALGLFVAHQDVFTSRQRGKMLFHACDQGKLELAKFLLENGADVSVRVENAVTVVMHLAQKRNWKILSLFCDYQSDENDAAQYGYAVVAAMRNGQVDLARKLYSRGALPVMLEKFESALFYAVKYELLDWIPELIEYEKGANNNWSWCIERTIEWGESRRLILDPYCYNAIFLARDLAEFKNKVGITAFFEEFSKMYYSPPEESERRPLDWDVERFHTAQLFIEALAIGGADFAAYRLIKYARHYQLIPGEYNSILTILDELEKGCYCYSRIENYSSEEDIKVIYQNFRCLLEREIKSSNQLSVRNNITFFSVVMSDKEFVARAISQRKQDKNCYYRSYLEKIEAAKASNCQTASIPKCAQESNSQITCHS